MENPNEPGIVPEAPKKKSKKKLIIGAVLGSLLIVAIVLGATTNFFGAMDLYLSGDSGDGTTVTKDLSETDLSLTEATAPATSMTITSNMVALDFTDATTLERIKYDDIYVDSVEAIESSDTGEYTTFSMTMCSTQSDIYDLQMYLELDDGSDTYKADGNTNNGQLQTDVPAGYCVPEYVYLDESFGITTLEPNTTYTLTGYIDTSEHNEGSMNDSATDEFTTPMEVAAMDTIKTITLVAGSEDGSDGDDGVEIGKATVLENWGLLEKDEISTVTHETAPIDTGKFDMSLDDVFIASVSVDEEYTKAYVEIGSTTTELVDFSVILELENNDDSSDYDSAYISTDVLAGETSLEIVTLSSLNEVKLTEGETYTLTATIVPISSPFIDWDDYNEYTLNDSDSVEFTIPEEDSGKETPDSAADIEALTADVAVDVADGTVDADEEDDDTDSGKEVPDSAADVEDLVADIDVTDGSIDTAEEDDDEGKNVYVGDIGYSEDNNMFYCELCGENTDGDESVKIQFYANGTSDIKGVTTPDDSCKTYYSSDVEDFGVEKGETVTLEVAVDYHEYVDETDETDNTAEASVTIGEEGSSGFSLVEEAIIVTTDEEEEDTTVSKEKEDSIRDWLGMGSTDTASKDLSVESVSIEADYTNFYAEVCGEDTTGTEQATLTFNANDYEHELNITVPADRDDSNCKTFYSWEVDNFFLEDGETYTVTATVEFIEDEDEDTDDDNDSAEHEFEMPSEDENVNDDLLLNPSILMVRIGDLNAENNEDGTDTDPLADYTTTLETSDNDLLVVDLIEVLAFEDDDDYDETGDGVELENVIGPHWDALYLYVYPTSDDTDYRSIQLNVDGYLEEEIFSNDTLGTYDIGDGTDNQVEISVWYEFPSANTEEDNIRDLAKIKDNLGDMFDTLKNATETAEEDDTVIETLDDIITTVTSTPEVYLSDDATDDYVEAVEEAVSEEEEITNDKLEEAKEGVVEAETDAVEKVSPFSDVAINEWYGESVNEIYELGIVSGYGDGSGYGPSNNVTVAEMLKIALMSSGWGPAPSTITPDLEQAQSHWASQYVAMAEMLDLSIVQDLYDLNRNATRAEVVELMLEAIVGVDGIPDYTTCSFADCENADDQMEDVEYAYELGIITGYPNGSFGYTNDINRAETATIVSRALAVFGLYDAVLELVEAANY